MTDWHPASEKPHPEDFPILYITRTARLELMFHHYNKRWACVSEFYEMAEWQPVALPHDMFGNAVKNGVSFA